MTRIPEDDSKAITQTLIRLKDGDPDAHECLMRKVSGLLQEMAERFLDRESRPDHTLQPTDLVNEAYLRLVDQSRVDWQSRTHFFAIAATIMGRILADHARARFARKRGGHLHKEPMDVLVKVPLFDSEYSAVAIMDLHGALEKLSKKSPRRAQIVILRFFAGMKCQDIATEMGISVAVVKRHWSFTKAWLRSELTKGQQSP